MRGLAVALVLAAATSACSGSSDAPTAPAVQVTTPTFTRGEASSNAAVAISVPSRWTRVGGSRIRFEDPSPNCTYEITVDAEIVEDDARSATDAARSQVPTGDGSVIDSGQRGSAAWRVVRHPGSTPIDIDAVRMQPLRHLSEQAGMTVWLATRAHAESKPGDECHSGSYRERVGPAIGDVLATARRLP